MEYGYEVVCYKDGVETYRAPRRFASLKGAYKWLLENVKASEDADIRLIDDSVAGLKIDSAIARFHGMTQYA